MKKLLMVILIVFITLFLAFLVFSFEAGWVHFGTVTEPSGFVAHSLSIGPDSCYATLQDGLYQGASGYCPPYFVFGLSMKTNPILTLPENYGEG